MKKFLSLLSILTINGTAMPNVIAASNYEKNDDNILLINNEKYKNDFFLTNKNIGENTINIFVDKKNNEILYFMNFNEERFLKEIFFIKNKETTLFINNIEDKKYTDFIKVNDKFYFCNSNGIYEFDKAENKYTEIYNSKDEIYKLNIDNQNNIYYLSNNLLKIKKLKFNNNQYEAEDVIITNDTITCFSFDKDNNIYYTVGLDIFKKNTNQSNASTDNNAFITLKNKNINDDKCLIKKIVILDDNENNILINLNIGKFFFMLNEINIPNVKVSTFSTDNKNNIYYLDFSTKNIFNLSKLINTNKNISINNKNIIWISVGSIILGFILIGTLLSLYIICFKKRKKHNFKKKNKL